MKNAEIDMSSYDDKAGLTLNGSATVILEETNTLKGSSGEAGLYVPENKTLTIKGSGSLKATSGDYAAGIGGSCEKAAGNIVIESGTITAKSSSSGAGIGSGYYGSYGTITVNGGTVTATSNDTGAGIGSGYYSSCGAVSINGGTVNAVGGQYGAGIGSGYGGSCESVTATNDITKVTATKGQNAENIGAGHGGSCGTVTIGNMLVDTTDGNTRTLKPMVDLSKLTGDYTAQDGDILTNTLGGNYNISVEDGATVTLKNAKIDMSSYYGKAGLTLNGSATVILEETNTLKGGMGASALYVPENNTLTVKGSGSLNAAGGDNAAGIGSGSGSYGKSGNIVIESGTITAIGGEDSAGIGTGYDGTCGTITISGGTVTATAGEDDGAGIGSGNDGECGAITISGGTVTANAFDCGAGIGSGFWGQCEAITISGGTVTANGSNCGAGIGCGMNAGCGAVTITDGITKVTATKGTSSIHIGEGSGILSLCGTITIAPSLKDTTDGNTRTIEKASVVVDLSKLTGDYVAQDGEILTGTLAGNYKISVADNATVTLRDVTINGVNSEDYRWAGINCPGNATLILEGENNVKGFYDEYPGVYIAPDKTLTIKGDGSLNARNNGWSCGIGGGYRVNSGNIVLEGGTITAWAGSDSPTATAIGTGYQSHGGTITIKDTINSVTAVKGHSRQIN